MPSKRPGFNNFSLYDDEEIKALKAVTRSLKAMTPEEGRASLIDAGIITKTGRLTKPYRELYKEDMEAIEAANALRASKPAPTRRGAAVSQRKSGARAKPATAAHRKHEAPGKKPAAPSPRKARPARQKAAAPRKQGAVSGRKSLSSHRGTRKHGP